MFDADQLALATRSHVREDAYRQQAPRYDPRSGEGARLRGGRYNPRGSFPTLYLCRSRACAAAELQRQAVSQAIGLEGFLPRVLYRYRIDLDDVVDLTNAAVQEALKIRPDDLVGRSWHFTQEIGSLAHHLGCQALVAPSATGVDSLLIVFVENIGLGVVEPTVLDRWTVPADLD